MNMIQINKFPTIVDNNHESLYRAYQILEAVKWLLSKDTPAEVIAWIIDSLESKEK